MFFGVLVLICAFVFSVPCYDVRYDFCIKTMFGSLLQVVCERACVVVTLFVFVCAQWSPTHIVFSFFSSPILPVFSGLSILIVPSVFSHVYLFVRKWVYYRLLFTQFFSTEWWVRWMTNNYSEGTRRMKLFSLLYLNVNSNN